jgi:hypothetical protein
MRLPKSALLIFLAFATLILPGCGTRSAPVLTGDTKKSSVSDLLTNPRFKFKSFPCVEAAQSGRSKTCPAFGLSGSWLAQGVWQATPQTPGSDLIFPEQVSIDCEKQEKRCSIQTVQFAVNPLEVSIEGPDETDYRIISWDAGGLQAAYFPPQQTSKCQRSYLEMNFITGEVTLTDFPLPQKKGCEMWKDKNSFRLAPGNYYVDTTQHNDSPAGLPLNN